MTRQPDVAITTRLDERFAILRELMRTLELGTLLGQQHVMNKMLLILRRELLGLEAPIAAADLASLSNAMTDLEHEAGHLAPTPSIFNRHVEAAIGALLPSLGTRAMP